MYVNIAFKLKELLLECINLTIMIAISYRNDISYQFISKRLQSTSNYGPIYQGFESRPVPYTRWSKHIQLRDTRHFPMHWMLPVIPTAKWLPREGVPLDKKKYSNLFVLLSIFHTF